MKEKDPEIFPLIPHLHLEARARCSECGHTETFFNWDDIYEVAMDFRASGWYVTDGGKVLCPSCNFKKKGYYDYTISS